MIHPKQFIKAYAKKVSHENGATVAEVIACIDMQHCMQKWIQESIPWLERGGMSANWWNAVINDHLSLALVLRWMRDNPIRSDERKHGIDYRLAIIRRDARAALVSNGAA